MLMELMCCLKLATESQALMCCGRLFHSLMELGKKEWRWESTEDWGIWKLDWLFLVALPGDIKSSHGISMSPNLAWKRVLSLVLALLSDRGGHPRESKFFLELPGIREWLPVTNLAALFWIFSRSAICPALWGSHTLHPYSSTGLTRELKHFSLTSGGQPYRLRWRKAKVELALLHSAVCIPADFTVYVDTKVFG